MKCFTPRIYAVFVLVNPPSMRASTGFLVFWESTRQALVPFNSALWGLSNSWPFWELPDAEVGGFVG